MRKDEKMGLLSKLLGGDKNAEKAAKDLLNGIIKNAQTNQSSANNNTQSNQTAANNNGASRNSPEASRTQSSSPSGFSWGENMPDEENQFNYKGPFTSYFENIFSTEFAGYRIEKDDTHNRRIVYTFYDGAQKALVVELKSQSNAAYKLRKECLDAGIPYLRFYYDHDGWWNTRSYVVTRVRQALGGN